MKEAITKAKWIYMYSRPFFTGIIIIITLGTVSSLGNIFKALVMKKLIDSATAVHTNTMIRYLVLFGAIMLADILIQATTSIISTRSQTKMCNNIQEKIYTHILNSQWSKLSEYHSGDIQTRITSDTELATNLIINTIPGIISLSVLLIGSFIALFRFDYLLATAAFLLSPVIILLSRLYSIKLKRIHSLLQQLESKYRSFINESVQNVVILKSFCHEKSNIRYVTSLQKDRLKLKMEQNNNSMINSAIFSVGSFITFLVVFTWGAFNLSRGNVTYGTISALLQLFGNIQYPFTGLATSVPKAVATMASIERLMELEQIQYDKYCNPLTEVDGAGLEFTGVSFGYKNENPVLENLSLKISKGEYVAIIGPSGTGKTTLVRLLLSLIYPQKGHVYITNAQEKHEINTSSRRLISYVPQGNTLFSGTIAENLRFGCPDATDTELEAAARTACAWDFIEELPDKLYTVIGERGLGLSEGQTQRLAIARALLRRAPILILDEATSALDIDTEKRIFQALHNINASLTCIIITHRMTALKICNRVLKLEKDHLIELSNQKTTDPSVEAV